MSLKNKLIKAAFGKLQKSIEKFKGFLKKHATLLALSAAALVLLNQIISQIKNHLGSNVSEADAINYVKNNRDLQKFIGIINQDTDDSYLNEIILVCENPDYYAEDLDAFLKSLEGKELSEKDFINMFNESDDFDQKIALFKPNTQLTKAISKIMGITPWLFLVYVLVIKIKEFLNQNEYPSPFRGKYLQRLIRNIGSIMKQNLKNEKQAASLLKSLKLMDAIIAGSLLASAIYLKNRKTLQKDALTTFDEIASAQLCQRIQPTIIPKIVSSPLDESLVSCPADLDENLVPHVPIEEKLIALSCEVTQDEEGTIAEGSQPDIATKALFENQSSKKFNILVKEGDMIQIDSPMATYDGERVYSNVNGIVEKTEPNKIYVKNISDPDQTYLEQIINKLNDAYKEQNDTKFFLSEFFISSLYPVMLKYSPLIDGKLSVTEAASLFYKTGGVYKRWEGVLKDFEKQTKDWNKRNQKIAGKDKVQQKAESEKMGDILIEMNESEKTLFKYLKADGKKGINQSKITKPDEKEFELIEFYFSLVKALSNYFDKNDVATTMLNQMNQFLRNRFFIDKYSVKKIQDKINAYCLNLSEGTYYFPAPPNFYEELLKKWNETNAKIGQRFTSGENYLLELQKKNTKKTDSEKTALREYILFLFNFSIEINNLISTKYSPEKTKWTQTELEGNWIESFFASLWKRYEALPKEIEDLNKNIDDIARAFTTYSIIIINRDQYRWYSIAESSCEPPEEDDPYLSPKSKKGYGDITYWLRYCSFATLASVANPATSWSTGLPPPLGPIPFPTVYIPIKSFETNWGFIVMGLTITGIYPFPWVLFVNWSSEYHVPLADPTTLMKKEIEALKQTLANQLSQFRKDRLKASLDRAKENIKEEEQILKNLQEQKRILRTEKPKRNRSMDPKEDIPRYTEDLFRWTTNMAVLDERILTEKKNKFTAETKYKIIKDAYDGAPVAQNSDEKIQALRETENQITKKFDKLDVLLSNMDKFLAPLPITTKPETANFAFTLKNPKPIINMAKDIDDNINYGPLDKITEKFEPRNEDLMKTNYGPVSAKTFNNFKAYKTALKVAMPAMIKSDPFPKYENLKPSNLPWMTFLLKEWAPTGAKTYGFPGFPPVPIG